MIHNDFVRRAAKNLTEDKSVIGLAVAGSWLTKEIDKYSDLDLILVTSKKISGNKPKMLEYAKQFGSFLTGFTGEHVGEPGILICLFDNPLIHVDIKFVTLEEFHPRIETPTILLDTEGQLKKALELSNAEFPYPDYQWIEDRFWVWIHYVLLKIGRGEYFEAFDFLGYLRIIVLGPLLHIKNGSLPRGVRKVETKLEEEDLKKLKLTLPVYDKKSLLDCLYNAVSLYRELRTQLFKSDITLQFETEKKVMHYFNEIKNKKNN